MKMDIQELYRTDPIKACRLALRRTVDVDFKHRMDAIDKLLGTHGVEPINGNWQNGYWADVVATYCNTGDSYGVTVIHERDSTGWNQEGRFFVGAWGDLVENDRWVKRNGVR